MNALEVLCIGAVLVECIGCRFAWVPGDGRRAVTARKGRNLAETVSVPKTESIPPSEHTYNEINDIICYSFANEIVCILTVKNAF